MLSTYEDNIFCKTLIIIHIITFVDTKGSIKLANQDFEQNLSNYRLQTNYCNLDWLPWVPQLSEMPGNHHLKSTGKNGMSNRPSPVPPLIPESGKQSASKCRNSDSLWGLDADCCLSKAQRAEASWLAFLREFQHRKQHGNMLYLDRDRVNKIWVSIGWPEKQK